jgi:hypothetical protein
MSSIQDNGNEIEVQIKEEFDDEFATYKKDTDYKDKYEILCIKFNSLLNYTELLYNENTRLQSDNLRFKMRLSSTSQNLAEKEKMFLILKSVYNSK